MQLSHSMLRWTPRFRNSKRPARLWCEVYLSYWGLLMLKHMEAEICRAHSGRRASTPRLRHLVGPARLEGEV